MLCYFVELISSIKLFDHYVVLLLSAAAGYVLYAHASHGASRQSPATCVFRYCPDYRASMTSHFSYFCREPPRNADYRLAIYVLKCRQYRSTISSGASPTVANFTHLLRQASHRITVCRFQALAIERLFRPSWAALISILLGARNISSFVLAKKISLTPESLLLLKYNDDVLLVAKVLFRRFERQEY